jgi:hypothetical protein
MKKFLLLSTFVSCALFINAQNFNWGIRAGLNASSLGDYEHTIGLYQDSELDNKLGAYAGIFGQFMLSGNLGLETGLYYAQLGGKDRENDYERGNLEQYKIEANPSYLQLPIALFYKFNLTENFKLYPSAGLYAGYGLTGDFKKTGTADGVDITSKEKYFKDFANKLDFGLTVGLNVQYSKFVLGFHYDRGLTRVNKVEETFSSNAFNSNLRCSLAYLFR